MEHLFGLFAIGVTITVLQRLFWAYFNLTPLPPAASSTENNKKR
jgi:hypothetical protein